jgi:hypothetical protein
MYLMVGLLALVSVVSLLLALSPARTLVAGVAVLLAVRSYTEPSYLALRSTWVVPVGAAVADLPATPVDEQLSLALSCNPARGLGGFGLRLVRRARAAGSFDLYTPSLVARDYVNVALVRHPATSSSLPE